MAKAVRMGTLYFAIVFAIGFILGALRTLVVAPLAGDVAAVVIELPLMLGASWLVCGRLLPALPAGIRPRLVMGGTAFALLMLAEYGMAIWFFGRSPAAYAAAMALPAGLIGLAGQIGFALMPLVRR